MCLQMFSSAMKVVMYLVAGYFDESYDDETHGKCYTVAGLFGNQMAITVLGLKWRDLNRKWGIGYFKASELNAGEGQFKQFRDDPGAERWIAFSPREKRLFQQIKTEYTDLIVEETGVYGVGVCLVLPDYFRLKKENEKARKYLLHPYHQCAQLALMEAGFQVNDVNLHAAPDNIAFLKPIFDSHIKHEPRMKRAFPVFCQKNPISSRYLLPPDYESEKEHCALQAADNLAYESRGYLMHRHFNNPLVPRISMSRLLEVGAFVRLYKLDYRSLKLMVENQSEDRIPNNPIDVKFSQISGSDVGLFWTNENDDDP